MSGLVFDNVAISVTDLDRSVEWYDRVFGLRPAYRTFIKNIGAHFVLLERPDLRIELLCRPGAVRAPEMVPGPHLATSGLKAVVFRTDDLEGETARLEALGVALVWRLEALTSDGMRATMIRDPDGTLINILCYPMAT